MPSLQLKTQNMKIKLAETKYESGQIHRKKIYLIVIDKCTCKQLLQQKRCTV
jgi:hypothetical protein